MLALPDTIYCIRIIDTSKVIIFKSNYSPAFDGSPTPLYLPQPPIINPEGPG